MRRVVVTGMSLVSSLGFSTAEAFERLKVYKNTVKYMESLEQYHYTRKVLRTMGRVSVMSVACTEKALEQAGLLNDSVIQNGRTGVSYGSSSGTMEALIDFYSMQVEKSVKGLTSGSYVKMMAHTAPVNISMYFKTTGRLITTSTACTSGSLGVGSAYEAIKNGYADVMIAGGSDELHPTQIAIFDTLYATSQKNSTPELTPSPFDAEILRLNLRRHLLTRNATGLS